MEGWAGKLLRVDLGRGRLATEELSLEQAQRFLGGRGLAVSILSEEVGPGVDPLGPENRLILMAGPLTGTAAPGGCVLAVVAASPLTNTLACGLVKGHFGSELKHAGWDGIIIEGQARHPVYLSIQDGAVRLLPALQLWGRTTGNCAELIGAELKDPWLARETRVLSIGPAGERLALTASLVAEDCLVPGAAGLGAVMGAKRLKAIAVRGTGGLKVAQGDLFQRAVSALLNRLRSAPLTSQVLPRLGTPFLLEHLARHGALPTGHFAGAATTGPDGLSPERLAAFRTRNRSCFACPIGCQQFTELRGATFTGRGKGPEHDAAAQFGAACGVEELPAVLAANYLCTAAGLDPVSAGAAIACAMSLSREGHLSASEAGLPLSFGDPEALLLCLEQMAAGKGFGGLLASGARRLAEECGHPEAFLGAKGLAMPPYDVRAIQGLGLNFATSNVGPFDLNGLTVIDELLGVHQPANPLEWEGKAAQVKLYQDATAALDSMGVCVWPLTGMWVNNLVPILRAVTGLEMRLEEILQVGERIWNLERAFGLRSGLNGASDSLPATVLTQAVPAGPAKGRVCELARMLPEYYRLRGWSPKGVPSPETLARLGLG